MKTRTITLLLGLLLLGLCSLVMWDSFPFVTLQALLGLTFVSGWMVGSFFFQWAFDQLIKKYNSMNTSKITGFFRTYQDVKSYIKMLDDVLKNKIN